MKKKQLKLSAIALAIAAGIAGPVAAFTVADGNSVGYIYTDGDETGDPGLIIRAGDTGAVGSYNPYTSSASTAADPGFTRRCKSTATPTSAVR